MDRSYPRVIICLIASVLLVSACTTEGSGIGKRSRLISDKHGTEKKPYKTEARLLASIQALKGKQLYDFQVEELKKINDSLGKELDILSQIYIKKVGSITGVKIEVLDKLRPQIDSQTIQVSETIVFPFVEAKRQRKLTVQERDLLNRLDNQRRIDISHVHTRYANQIAAVTGLSMPAIYAALIQPY